jgi:hypothetical protein
LILRILGFTCFLCVFLAIYGIHPEISAAQQRHSSGNTRLMQQSDHRQRMEDAKQEKAQNRQAAAMVATVEGSPGTFDYVILLMVVASLAALVILSRRRRGRPRYR